MPYVDRATAPTFNLAGTTFVGLSAPSRGAAENCVWQATIPSHTAGNRHSLDREEILVILRGSGTAAIGGELHELGVGDALIVPANTMLQLSTAAEDLELLAVLPVGGQATLAGGQPFSPPWAC